MRSRMGVQAQAHALGVGVRCPPCSHGVRRSGLLRRLAQRLKSRIKAAADGGGQAVPPAQIPQPLHPVLASGEQAALQRAIRLSFCGDLILLRDAAENGCNETTGEYDFSPMFKEVEEYWKSADLAVGVFEGPMAGADRGYSSSIVVDRIPLHLNYPDCFAQNIKDAGIGLVTTANNHLMDMGAEGALRTLDVLDRVGLDHLGSYRNQEEHDAVKVRTVRGKRIAFLAYTYGSEGCSATFSSPLSTAI